MRTKGASKASKGEDEGGQGFEGKGDNWNVTEPQTPRSLGNFLEGRVWIEDENGQATTALEIKNGQKLLRGTWIDIYFRLVQRSETIIQTRNPPKK